ncbi:TPA: protein mom, partial [Escherichia coli]|nr:protein mom [Escherichia coli]
MPASIPRRNIVGKEKKSRILTKPCVIEYEGQ